VNPLVEQRSLPGIRGEEVGFFARTEIKAGTIVLTADALSLFELDGREDLEGMRDWAEFLVSKLPLSVLKDLYPRTLAQAKTLPVLGKSPEAGRILAGLATHVQALPPGEQDQFLQEALLFHKLVANAFSYTDRYMCIFHAASVFNHARESNVKTTSNGKRMVFQAKRVIAAGEELTINYGNDLYD
jgi:hypothetical protein